jgi:YHS domain-containing protein
MKKGPNKCPVCGMMVGYDWPTEYNGKTYYFMNPAHRESFIANPSRFLK